MDALCMAVVMDVDACRCIDVYYKYILRDDKQSLSVAKNVPLALYV